MGGFLAEKSYSDATLAELGIPSRKFRCAKRAVGADAARAQAAAMEVAQYFQKHFREDLQLAYLLPYLETVLSKVAGTDAGSAAEIMGHTITFVKACLLRTAS